MHHTAERPLFIEMIRTQASEYSDRARKAGVFGRIPDKEPGQGLFTVYTGNQWIELEQQRPMPKRLFGELWYQGELCILFADTTAGKSVLAVQIGNSLTRCEPIGPFAVEAEPANVLYIDFELTGKQFQQRYSSTRGNHDFGNGFFRAEFNCNAEMPPEFKNFDEYVNNALEFYVKNKGADVLIIDNITCLRSGTERAADALPLMKHLKALKTKYQLSILVLAHTPKRNPAHPLSVNDLQGSKMLINFADSAFAIGSSTTDKELKYLKQIKQRNTAQLYGENNVCLCRIKKETDFLLFNFEGHSYEHKHLLTNQEAQRQLLTAKIARLSARGLSQRQISRELKISLGLVNKLI